MNDFYAFRLLRHLQLFLLVVPATLMLIFNSSFAQQKTLNGSDKPVSYTQTATESCDCTQTMILPKKGTYFFQSIKTFTKDDDLQQGTGWLLADKENTFKALFIKNFMSDVSGWSGQTSMMSVIAINTLVKLTHPDNTYIINLTPCNSDTRAFELPLVMHRRYDMLKYDSHFNYKDFDHTAQSYLRVLFLRLELHPDVVLRGLLAKMIDNDGGPEQLTFSRFIQTINKRYNISIPEASLDKEKDKENISLILTAIKAKYINPEQVINDEFVLTERRSHVMNTKEKANLSRIITEFYGGGFNFDNIDKQLLQPQYSAGVDVKHIGIEINDKVIRSWDAVNKRPLLDSNKKPVPSRILAEVSGIKFSSDDGVYAKIRSVCSSASEISGTGITLNFDHAVLIDQSLNKETNFSEYNYPLFRITPKREDEGKTVDGMTIATYDTLITRFSGLLIPEAPISIPFKGETIHANVKNLIINNKLISGEIALELDQSQSALNESISLKIGNRIILVNIKDLQKVLYNCGIKDVRFETSKNYLIILFKKTYHV